MTDQGELVLAKPARFRVDMRRDNLAGFEKMNAMHIANF
jgi:hypothetical protein